MPEEGCLLYCCLSKVDFARQMPPFDEWGLRPAGLEGPRENPVSMAPLPATGAATSLEVGAGGRPSSATGDAAAEASAPLGAPGGPTHGSLESRPDEAAEGASQPDAPEATAPDAPAGRREAEGKVSTQYGTPEVTSSGASPAEPGVGDCNLGFGWLRLNFDALRKRKGSPSCSGDAFRPLKQRKYNAVDE
nr:translation initiation factor IF-2-like [Aegilops tauschii subsp. strangulata]